MKTWPCRCGLEELPQGLAVLVTDTMMHRLDGGCHAMTTPTPDLVNHPPHYQDHPSGVECITIAEGFNYNKGNAIKYIWRAGKKSDAIVDLEKARWYIDREIARVKAEWANRDPL